jgi:hypothetical protein
LGFPSRLLSQEGLEGSPSAAGDARADDTESSASFEDDLEFVRSTKANLLVVGADFEVMAIVRRVIAEVSGHIVIPCREARPPLARLALHSTIVLRDLDALDADGQRQLFDWLDAPGTAQQIVSTASRPLLPLVNAGSFDRGLYYRLNTIYVRLCD